MQARLFRFVTALNASGLDPRCIERVGERVPAMLFGLDSQGAHAAGGSVPASIRDDALKMLADLTVAARTSGERAPGWRAARKLLRFAGHCIDFADLARRAERFRHEHHAALRAARE